MSDHQPKQSMLRSKVPGIGFVRVSPKTSFRSVNLSSTPIEIMGNPSEREPASVKFSTTPSDCSAGKTGAQSQSHQVSAPAGDLTTELRTDVSSHRDQHRQWQQTEPVPDLPDYTILEEVGRGGMGVVYKARHTALNKTMAAKVLHKELAEDAVNVRRFHQEAKAASFLSHPNLVAVYDSGISTDGKPFLIMDYLNGSSLDVMLQRMGFLELNVFHHVFEQVCEGLSHAHHKGVIHRDLKPANIMVIEAQHDSNFVKIVDFGIARLLQQTAKDGVRVTQTGDVIGSPSYMSPEQCLGHPMDERSDIYSLGVVMYEALTGCRPFEGENAIQIIVRHVQELPISPRRLRPDLRISERLDSLIMRCLSKRPDERWESVDEVSAELEASVKGADASKGAGFNLVTFCTGRQSPSWCSPRLQKSLPAMAALVLIGMVALGYSIFRTIQHSSGERNSHSAAIRSNVPLFVGEALTAPLLQRYATERAAQIQKHLADAHQALASLDIERSAGEFKNAYHLSSEGQENQYPSVHLCVEAGDAIVGAILDAGNYDSLSSDNLKKLREDGRTHAIWFYKIAQKFYEKEHYWPDEELQVLQKMESAGADVSVFERHITLLEKDHYAAKQISAASYSLGLQYLGWNSDTKEAEKAWLRGLPYALKSKGTEYSFPSPIEALADLYHSKGKYNEEVVLRKESLKHFEEAIADGEGGLYGWAARGYRHWLYGLQRLGRTSEYKAVKRQYDKLRLVAKRKGYVDDGESNTPPHLSI